MTEAQIALFRGKTAHGGPPMPSKRPSARFQPETREKRRPARSVVASINLDEFSHGLLGFSISNDGSERRIAPKALDKFKGRIRDMTRRTRGFSLNI